MLLWLYGGNIQEVLNIQYTEFLGKNLIRFLGGFL